MPSRVPETQPGLSQCTWSEWPRDMCVLKGPPARGLERHCLWAVPGSWLLSPFAFHSWGLSSPSNSWPSPAQTRGEPRPSPGRFKEPVLRSAGGSTSCELDREFCCHLALDSWFPPHPWDRQLPRGHFPQNLVLLMKKFRSKSSWPSPGLELSPPGLAPV